MAKYSDLVFRYMRIDHLPQIWCPGCGNGILMRDVVVAIDNLKLEREKVVIVSGIGCSSRTRPCDPLCDRDQTGKTGTECNRYHRRR